MNTLDDIKDTSQMGHTTLINKGGKMEPEDIYKELYTATADTYLEKIREVSSKVKKQGDEVSSIFYQLSSLKNQFDKHLVDMFIKENPKGYEFHFKKNDLYSSKVDLVLSYVKENKINKTILTEIASRRENTNLLLEELTYLPNRNIIHICSYVAPNEGSNFHRYYIFNVDTCEIEEMKNPKIELLKELELLAAIGCPLGKRLKKKIEHIESEQIYAKNYSGVLLRREEYSTMRIN